MSNFRFSFFYVVLFIIFEYLSHGRLVSELLADNRAFELTVFIFFFAAKICVLIALMRIEFSCAALSFVIFIGVLEVFPELMKLVSYFNASIVVTMVLFVLLLLLLIFGQLWEFFLKRKLSKHQLMHGACFLWSINFALSNPQNWFVI